MIVIILSLLALFAVANGTPRHHHRHAEFHRSKRAVVTVTDVVMDVVLDVVTVTAPTVILYVDTNGVAVSSATKTETEFPTTCSAEQTTSVWPTTLPNPWSPQTEAASEVFTSTSRSIDAIVSSPKMPVLNSLASVFNTKLQAVSSIPKTILSPVAASSSRVVPLSVQTNTASTEDPSPTETTTSAASSSTETISSAVASPTGLSEGSFTFSGYGLSYSAYNADSSCKNQDQVNTDFESIDDYSIIRLYGTDCNQTAMVLSAASAKNMKVFAGVYDITQVTSEVQLIIDAAQDCWDRIYSVAIGNEGVNDGTYTVADVVSALNVARGMLTAAKYTGGVVTVDTFVAIIDNPELCQASDFAAANCHPFFNAEGTAEEAGNFVKDQAGRVSEACPGKDTIITETGWPWQGQINGLAVPSIANQQVALASLRANFYGSIFLFEAFDDMWKQNYAGSFDTEQFWGIINHDT